MTGESQHPHPALSSQGRGDRQATRVSVADRIRAAPCSPGVYLFKNLAGKVIYVGKAKNLCRRLSSYVRRQSDTRHILLVANAADLDCIVTTSELEALAMEESLIKLHKPRYNVRLKDDKRFPYLKIAIKERFPPLIVTRRVRDDNSLYFGPYTDVRALRRTVATTQRVFRLRTCHKPIASEEAREQGKIRGRACLSFHLGRCSAPCQGAIDEGEYRRQVNAAISFLSGQGGELRESLEAAMWQASAASDFERAAQIRDQLWALDRIRRRQPQLFGDRQSRDALGVVLKERTAYAALLRFREGSLVSKNEHELSLHRSFSLQSRDRALIQEVVESLIAALYAHTRDIPSEIIVPAKLAEQALFEQWLRSKTREPVSIVYPQRGIRRHLSELAQKNAERLAARAAEVREPAPAVRELARILGLLTPPLWIEGVDISNISGTLAVGSVVVFVNGRPRKSEYRRLRVKGVRGPDDCAMMREVLGRRLRRILSSRAPKLPDLLLVDGGKGQLSAATSVYRGFGQRIPILGFAKRTDLIYYSDGSEIQIPTRSPALKLLKQVRDEAHRFAISFHRQLRGKAMRSSVLDGIAGIGERKKQALIGHFGSIERIRNASADELRQVSGIGRSLAQRIRAELSRQWTAVREKGGG